MDNFPLLKLQEEEQLSDGVKHLQDDYWKVQQEVIQHEQNWERFWEAFARRVKYTDTPSVTSQ